MTNFPHCSPCPPGGRTSPLVSPEQSPSHAPSAKRRLLLRSDASVHKFSLSERKLATEGGGGGEGRGLSRCLMLQNGSDSSDMLLNEKASYVPRKALINSKQLSHLEIIFSVRLVRRSIHVCIGHTLKYLNITSWLPDPSFCNFSAANIYVRRSVMQNTRNYYSPRQGRHHTTHPHSPTPAADTRPRPV